MLTLSIERSLPTIPAPPLITNPRKNELTQKVSHFYSQPNAHLEGTSFDANHLSSFIMNSKYTKPVFSTKPVTGGALGLSASSQSNQTSNNNVSLKSLGQNAEKPSSFFVSPNRSRILIDFPSNYSNLNPLVLPDLNEKGHIIDIDEFPGDEPKVRRDLIIKNAYKSGILNIDNPLNDHSRVYQSEHEIFKKRQEYLNCSKERQAKMIAKYTQTSPLIEFFNKKHDPKIAMNDIALSKITPYWSRKARPNEGFLERWKDTHTRVFSVEPDSFRLERARFLREKDVGKKDYDIIGGTSNQLDIKQREIIKVLG